jgi:ParB-like chromosome segregation protein Spo0J
MLNDHGPITDASLAHIAPPLRSLAVPIDSLTLDPANARTHDQKNLEAIKGSLSRFGQRLPLVVQRQGMIVRAGNGRLMAAKELGWTHVAVVVVDESEVEATAYAIADNRSSELAEWDDESLATLLQSLPSDLQAAAGFSDSDLTELLDSLTPHVVEEDDVPEPARAGEPHRRSVASGRSPSPVREQHG